MQILIILIIIVTSWLSQSMAAGAISILFYCLGVIISKSISSNKIEFSEALRSFNVIFSVLLVFACIRYFDILSNWSYFNRGEDETNFWIESENACNLSFKYLIKHDLLDNEYWENGLYYFYIRSLALCATIYLDGNHVYYQLLGSSLPTALASVFFFKILGTYVKGGGRQESICFILCTCIFPISLIIHRDQLVLLNYSIVLYISLCKKFSICNAALILIIGFITFFLREQSGLFIVLLLLGYVWVNLKKYKSTLLIITAIIAIESISLLMFIFDIYQDTITSYGLYRDDTLKTAGLSAYAEILPFPLKEVALLLQGQFQPLPIWAKFPSDFSLYGFIMGTFWAIISIYWFRVFTQTTWFVIRKRKQIPSTLICFYIIFILFLFLNVSNADPRRMMCMYIIPFVIYNYNKKYVLEKQDIRLFDKWYYSSVAIMMLAIILLKA